MDNDVYKKNFAALKKYSSETTHQSVSGAQGKIIDFSSENNVITGYFLSPHGKILIHSKRDPEAEAYRQIEQWIKEQKGNYESLMVVVIGFGLMYHIKALAEYLDDGATIFVADTHPNAVKSALNYCNPREITEKKIEIFFSVSQDKNLILRDFRKKLKARPTISWSCFVLPSYKRAFPEDVSILNEKLKREAYIEAMDRNTLIQLSGEWIQHALANIPLCLTNPSVASLKDAFKGKTAIVAAAGPSLTDALPFLSHLSQSYPIICVGTALKPLLKANIRPDFTVVVDSSVLIVKQFDGVPIEKTFFVASPIVYPPLLKIFDARLFLFTIGGIKGYNMWLGEFDMCPMPLSVGGTVTLTAMDFALLLGCENIILVGLDLAFKEDGTTHAKESMYDDKRFSKQYRRLRTLTVPGNYTEIVRTTKQFLLYKEMIQAYIREMSGNSTVKFYNATTGGAKIEGTVLIKPENISSLDLDGVEEGFEKYDYIKGIYDEALRKMLGDVSNAKAILKETIAKTCESFDEIINLATEGEKICDILLREDLKYCQKLLARLDILEAEIKKRKLGVCLINSFMEPVYWHICSDYDDKERRNDPKEIIKKSRFFYVNMRKFAEEVKEFLIGTET